MFDVSGSDSMFESRLMYVSHPSDTKIHATSRTSKLGMAIAPAPPIRARMRVT
jgi:hypothetical protein